MLKFITRHFSVHADRARRREQRERIEAWSLLVGREAAELWVQSLSARDTVRLSNA